MHSRMPCAGAQVVDNGAVVLTVPATNSTASFAITPTVRAGHDRAAVRASSPLTRVLAQPVAGSTATFTTVVQIPPGVLPAGATLSLANTAAPAGATAPTGYKTAGAVFTISASLLINFTNGALTLRIDLTTVPTVINGARTRLQAVFDANSQLGVFNATSKTYTPVSQECNRLGRGSQQVTAEGVLVTNVCQQGQFAVLVSCEALRRCRTVAIRAFVTSTSHAAPEASTTSSSNGGLLIGVIILALVAGVFAVVAVFFYRRHKSTSGGVR
jgi:hypothetical protein